MPVRPHPVKTVLVERGERQTEFSVRLGYSKDIVTQVLNGHVAAWPEFRRRAAAALKLPEADLFPTDMPPVKS